MMNVRDDIQKQVLQMVFKGSNSIQKPEEQGQTELKSVYSLLEKQLKNIDPSSAKQNQDHQHSPTNKKILKPIVQRPFLKTADDQVQEEQLKKKRVDKNKCRVCGESTIPQILDLINEDRGFIVEHNSDMTMRKIRENLLMKKGEQLKSNDTNKQQKVPYIALNYSQKIAICKRCRFKFHSKCLEERDSEFVKMQENWICSFCDDKIKELQSLDLWDYENKKKKKKEEPLAPVIQTIVQPSIAPSNRILDSILIKKRIGEKKKIFKVVINKPKDDLTAEQKQVRFLQQYPLYKKQDTEEIEYPIYDEKGQYKPYCPIEFKQKPQYTRIQNEQFSKLFSIQSLMGLLPINLDSLCLIQDDVDKSKSVLFTHLLVCLSLIYDEIICEKRFDFYQRVCNLNSAAFFQILRFNHIQLKNEEQFNKVLLKLWSLFSQQVLIFQQESNYYRARQTMREQYILQTQDESWNLKKLDSEEGNTTYRVKLQTNQQLTTEDLVDLIYCLTKGLYDLESFANLLANRENLQFESGSDNIMDLQALFHQENPKIFTNKNICLGQDQENRIYYWTRSVQDRIFVKDSDQWGFYNDDQINKLVDCLQPQGVRENQLLQILQNLKKNKMFDHQHQKIVRSSRLFNLVESLVTIQEIAQMMVECEFQIQDYLQTKYCRWAKRDIRQQFIESVNIFQTLELSRVENPSQIYEQLIIFVEGLQAIEKIEPHPRNRIGQDQSVNQELNSSILVSDNDEFSSSDQPSIHQLSNQQYSSSLNPKDEGVRQTRNRNNSQKPQSMNAPSIEPKQKFRQPLPPFNELEMSQHSSRRTQTKIFFFNNEIKSPLLHFISIINKSDIQSLYLCVITIQLILKDYLIQKQLQRQEPKEKRKRGRISKIIEDAQNQMKEMEQESLLAHMINEEQHNFPKNEMFEFLVKTLDCFEQMDEEVIEQNEENVLEQIKPILKSPKIVDQQSKKIPITCQPDSLANRREKRGNAGKNPKIMDFELPEGHKKYCSKCMRPIDQDNLCQKCSRSFHPECMVGDICKLCDVRLPIVNKMTFKSKRSGQQIFIDE